jgi:cation diffusion facilitator family transporter
MGLAPASRRSPEAAAPPGAGAPSADQRARRSLRVAVVAVVGAVGLLVVKLAVFFATDSAAVLTDALESLVNLAAALIALFSVWYASRPPDREHPYGHGKIEFIAVAMEGALVIAAGGLIAIEAVGRLMAGTTPRRLTVGAAALAVIAVALAGLALYIWRSGRALQSPTLIADGKHLLTDAGSTLGVGAALLLVWLTGWWWVDPAVALGLCVFIVVTGVNLIRRSLHGLLDRIDEADDAAIRGILDEEVSAGRIESYEKVRHRHQGAYHWVDMHLRFPPDMAVDEAHARASEIENRIESEMGEGNATAHIEPEKKPGSESASEPPEPSDRPDPPDRQPGA